MNKMGRSTPWASVCIYLYGAILVAQIFAASLIMHGSTKIGGQFFLGVLGVALPNIVLAAFFALAVDSATTVEDNIALTSFGALAAILNGANAVFFMLHVFFHGAARSLQPSEFLGDSGTSYTFAVAWMIINAVLMGWQTIEVIGVYCLRGSQPCRITFDHDKIISCEESFD